MGGPIREQSFVCHDDPSPNCGVSYGAHFKSTRPHCVALIVNIATCGPKYNTNVCRPEPSPMDDATPRPTHQSPNRKYASTSLTYFSWGPSKIARVVTLIRRRIQKVKAMVQWTIT